MVFESMICVCIGLLLTIIFIVTYLTSTDDFDYSDFIIPPERHSKKGKLSRKKKGDRYSSVRDKIHKVSQVQFYEN